MILRLFLFIAFVLLSACGRTSDIESGYALLPGGELYYEISGQGDPVVLIHGTAGDQRHWDHQMDALRQNYKVIRYDVRGYGKSLPPENDFAFSDYHDLALLLDYLEIDTAHIVGYSMGAGIGLDFAVEFPHRVQSLTSVGPWVNGRITEESTALNRKFAEVATTVINDGAAAGTKSFIEIGMGDSIRTDAAAAEFELIARDYGWWSYTQSSAQTSLTPAAATRLAEFTVPTMIITAEYDLAACREMGAFMHANISHAEYFDMPGTGHLMQIERPQIFNQALISFLDKH